MQSTLALALSGNNLYISQDYGATNWVGEYNATTGATINAQLFTTNPAGAYGLEVVGNDLLVAGYQNGTVGEYNATTGAVINASFISGLSDPIGLAVVGNTLYVSQDEGDNPGVISTFNVTTGASIDPDFITGLNGPTFYGRCGSGAFDMVDDCSGRRGVARNDAPEKIPHRIEILSCIHKKRDINLSSARA